MRAPSKWIDARNTPTRRFAASHASPNPTTNFGSYYFPSPPEPSVSDGAGGVYVVWGEWRERPFTTLYIQHVTASGDVAPGWTSLGRKVTDVGADQYTAKITSDGNGGVIVAWEQFSSTLNEVRMQRIDAAGALLWGPAGVRIDIDAPAYLGNVLTDGSGGAFVSMWANFGIYPDFTNTVVLQHLTANGAVAPGWPQNGLQPTTAQYASPGPESLIPDGSGGVFTVWADNTGSATFMAQRITADGTSLWAPGGIVLLTEEPFSFPRAASDGQGGLLLAWSTFPAPYDIHAQRFDGNGFAMWGAGSAVVCDDPGPQYDPLIASDGAGGACVAWTDYRSGPATVYAMRMNSSGSNFPGWPDNGKPACPGCVDPYPYYSLPATLAGDGNGGAFMTWYFEVAWGLDIFMQHLDGTGAVAGGWPQHATRVEEQPGSAASSPPLVEPDGSVVLVSPSLRTSTTATTSNSRNEWMGRVKGCGGPRA
jgi:hypothetical protein